MAARKDADKQKQVIKLSVVSDRKRELVEQYGKLREQQQEFDEAIKACAEASGLQASVVRRFIVATQKEQVDDKNRDADQLSLLFEEVRA